MAGGINHVMLGIAREARGLTQSQLAAKLGVAQGTISKAENIPDCASGEIVDAYAKALSYPRSFFYQQHEYRHLPVVFYRKRKSVSAVEYHQIEAVANIMRSHLRAIAAHAELPDLVLPCVDLSRGTTTPEVVARELRVRWHVQPGPIDNITMLMEDNGILVVPHDFGEAKIDGLSVWEPKDKIRPFVFVNHHAPPDRWRFTLAHELGHLILHHHQALPSEECEDEANRFASEFLTPEKELRGHLVRPTIENLAALKARWKVSMQMLIMKAGAAGTITPKQKSRLMIQMSSLGYRTKEPVDLPVERATLLHELFDYMVKVRKLTENDIRSMLHLESEEMYQTYPVPRPQGLRLVRPTSQAGARTLDEAVNIAVSEGILAAEEKNAERYKDAKRRLAAWCEASGVSPARRDLALSQFKERVALLAGPKTAAPADAGGSCVTSGSATAPAILRPLTSDEERARAIDRCDA